MDASAAARETSRGESCRLAAACDTPRISANAPQGCKLLLPAFYRTAAAALSGAMRKRIRLSGVGIQKRMREAACWRRRPGAAILRQRPAFVPLIRASTRSVLVYRAAFPTSEKHLVQAALPLHWPKMRTPALRIYFRSASACWFEWLWAVGVGGGEASAPLIAPSKQTYILLLPYLRLARFASYCSAYFLKVVRYACPGLCACAWKIWPQSSRRASRLQQQPARLIPHPFHPNFLCLSNIRIPAIPSGTGCVFCLTSPRRYGIISLVRECFARAHEGAWCNGNTWVSKTFVEGSSPSAPARNFVQSAAIGLHIFVMVSQSPFAFLPTHLRINGCRYCMLLQHPRVQAVLTKS